MATVSLPSRVLGRKMKKMGAFFVENVFWGILPGEELLPSLPCPLATPVRVSGTILLHSRFFVFGGSFL